MMHVIDNVSLQGARGVLISITGGKDLTLYEVDEAATRIREEVDADANIIVAGRARVRGGPAKWAPCSSSTCRLCLCGGKCGVW
jgi:hypothetical protein